MLEEIKSFIFIKDFIKEALPGQKLFSQDAVEDVRKGSWPYKIAIAGRGDNADIRVIANITEQFTYGFTNDWVTLGDSSAIPDFVKKPGQITGLWTAQVQRQSQLLFAGVAGDFTFNLPLFFYTFSNPLTDVRQPIQNLEKLSVPSIEAQQFKPLDYVAVTIGRNFYLNEVAIKGLRVAWSVEQCKWEDGAYPLYAAAELTLALPMKPSRQDIEAMYIKG